MAKNDGTPVHLLALDGGGIRGICELRVLDEIMRRVQKEQKLDQLPRPCDYFHLMAGTSTGGLVAILLSRFKMTTEDAIKAYYDLSGKIFAWKNKKGLLNRTLPFLHTFNEVVFEQVIKDLVSQHKIGELMFEPEHLSRSKAFVCSQQAHQQGKVVRFRTYEPPAVKKNASLAIPSPSGSSSSSSSSSHSSSPSPSCSYSISSSSTVDAHEASPANSGSKSTTPVHSDPFNEYRDIAIWEAARATTAAPSYFDPIVLSRGGSTRAFIDGAMGCNNPARELIDEATALFGTDCTLGCLLSLGTGFSGPLTIGNRAGLKGKFDLINNIKKIATDTEKVHKGLRDQIRIGLDTYFRFQLPNGAEKIGLHEYKKLDELSQLMKAYIEQKSSEMDKIVRILTKKSKPKGVKLGEVARNDHGQICPPKLEVRSRPHVTNFFRGRDDVLETLDEVFRPDPQGPTRQRHYLLYGQPGVGKSQTAGQFLNYHTGWFDLRLWVDASSEETLEAGFKELRDPCAEAGYKGNGSAKSLLQWLEVTELRWILVLDDVRGDVSDYIPHCDEGNVLFTSQNRYMKPVQPLASMIDVLSEADAVEVIIGNAVLDEVDEEVREQAAELAAAVGYLPLTLEQAGATLRVQQIKIPEYAKLLEDHRVNLLKNPGTENVPLVLQAVYASFEVTYKVLNVQAHNASNEAEAAAARYALQILSLFSFYHNERLTGEIIKRAYEKRPPRRRQDDFGIGAESYADLMAATESGEWISNRWRSGINLLMGYSLVRTDQRKVIYSMHGLVHEWARNRVPDYIRRAHAKAARLVLFDSISDGGEGYEDYIYQTQVLPHVRAIMANTEDISMDSRSEEAIHYHRFGMLLRLIARPAEALTYLERALQTWIVDNTMANDRGLSIGRNIASALRSMGDYLDAQTLFRTVFEIGVRLRGDDDLQTLWTIPDIASLSIQLGKYQEGEKLLRDFIAVLKRKYPEAEAISSTNELAIALFYLDRLDEARDALIDVVHEAIDFIGYRHPFFFKAVNNLAVVQTRLGCYEEAEEMLLDVMRKEKEFFGPFYPARPISIHNLAAIYYYQGKFAEARKLFIEAGSLSEGFGKWTSLEHVYHIQGLSLVLYRKGRRQDAMDFGELCFDHLKMWLKKRHPDVKMAGQQMLAWIHEEERGLPIQTETIIQIKPLFRT